MTKFVIVEHDFADDYDSVWLLGRIADNPEGFLGAYVTQNGNVLFSDKSVWRIELDLERIGIDPWSNQGLDLIASWETLETTEAVESPKGLRSENTSSIHIGKRPAPTSASKGSTFTREPDTAPCSICAFSGTVRKRSNGSPSTPQTQP